MWVKICGVRDEAAMTSVALARPDAIGLNFFPRSPRYIAPAVAAELVTMLPTGIEIIGVFVNATRDRGDEIASIVRQVGLHGVQFHGDETPDDVGAVMLACPAGTKSIRSWIADGDWSRLPKYAQECRDLGVELFAILMDTHAPGQYGGTGQTVDWSALQTHYDFAHWPSLILAGGLKPENVADAIHAVQPWGVDVASGVESSPGVKDPERVRQFVEAARAT
jgi:phosphoribosylanthranilate isomerase